MNIIHISKIKTRMKYQEVIRILEKPELEKDVNKNLSSNFAIDSTTNQSSN